MSSEPGAGQNAGSEIDLTSPDLVAVRLPHGYIGRTFRTSGRMFDPEPLKQQPFVLFSARNLSPSSRFFRIRYDLPTPDWVPRISTIVIQLLGILLPVSLIGLSSSDKINLRRYKLIAIGIAGIYLLGYGYLFYLTIRSGGNLIDISQNLGFAIVTAFAAWLTYFIKSKAPAATTAEERPLV